MLFSSFRGLAGATALAATSLSLALPQNSDSSSTVCNNSPALCSKQYNQVTYLGAHNSAFLRDDSTDDSISGNQYLNATFALDAGLRLMQAQIHAGDSPLQLCHSSCGMMDAGSLQDWLAKIAVWMEANPHDVVTILLVNQNEDATADDFGAAFDAAGLGKMAYTPQEPGTATSSWPTLQSMIDENQRLVAFVTNIEYSSSAPYILPEFDYVFETPFEVTTIDGFNCTLDRPSSVDSAASALAGNMLSLVNHFKYQSLFGSVMVPDTDTLETVNDPGTGETGNLGKHLTECEAEWGVVPNFALIDFWSTAQPIEAVDAINKVNDASGREESPDGALSLAAHGSGQLGAGALLTFICAALLLV